MGEHGGGVGGSRISLLDDGLWQIDLDFQGRPGVIAAYLLEGGGELALIETGPSSTLPALLDGIRAAGFAPEQITAALVTHIHLDHSGAAGPLARMNPDLTVYAHPFGAPHLVDPARLVASATRIYGDRMETLWGEVAPIPVDRVVALAEGRTLSVAGRVLSVLFTPGHANHHVAYWDPASGAAFTGDAAGIRMPGTPYVCPPTPPPELDPAAWVTTVERLQALHPRRLLLTHFGAYDDAPEHLARLLPELEVFIRIAEEATAAGLDGDALTARLHDRMAAQLGDVPPALLDRLEWATPSYMATLGLLRYLSKRSR